MRIHRRIVWLTLVLAIGLTAKATAARRNFLLLITGVGLLLTSSCAVPQIRPIDGLPGGAAVSQDTLRFTALPAPWPGYDQELYRFSIPIQVLIENNRAEEIEVRYADFLLLDEGRNQYRVLSPDEVSRSLLGRAPTELLLACPGPLFFRGPSFFRDPFFFFRASFFDDPFCCPSFYPSPRYVVQDLARYAIREGRVIPQGKGSGFLFFQRIPVPTTRRVFDLQWTPFDPQKRETIATLSIKVEVLH